MTYGAEIVLVVILGMLLAIAIQAYKGKKWED